MNAKYIKQCIPESRCKLLSVICTAIMQLAKREVMHAFVWLAARTDASARHSSVSRTLPQVSRVIPVAAFAGL